MTQDLNYTTELVFTGLFVDVGENMSVLDRINLTFVYDEIGLKGKSSEEEENAVSVLHGSKQWHKVGFSGRVSVLQNSKLYYSRCFSVCTTYYVSNT